MEVSIWAQDNFNFKIFFSFVYEKEKKKPSNKDQPKSNNHS